MKSRHLARGITGFAAAALLVFICPVLPCPAETGEKAGPAYELETYTVTATKQEEETLDVPSNVTVMDGFFMQDMGIERIDELTGLSPNINIDKIDAHMTQVVFRGIGGLTNMNKVWNTNVDGVTVPYVGTDMCLDVERVELMRGSQGALYGRNTHAGVVNVVTRKPTEVFTLDASVTGESHHTQKANLAFGGPVNATQGYRVALGLKKGDGFHENEFRGTDDGGSHGQFTGRATWQFANTPGNRVYLALTGDSYDGDFDMFTPVSRGTTTTTINNEPGENSGSLISPALTWEHRFNGMTLSSISNFSRSDYGMRLDQDFSQADLMVLDYDEEFTTFTQEFRLAGSSNGINWLGGIFLMAERISGLTDFGFGSDAALAGIPVNMHAFADSTIDSFGGAVFGQASTLLLEKLEFRSSLRLDYETREFEWGGRTELMGAVMGPVQTYSREDDWVGVMPSAS